MIKRQPFSLDHFKELELEESDIGYDACSQLCQVLKYNRTIRYLNLYKNSVNDECVKCICEALKTNQSLIRLNLDANQLSEGGCQSVIEILSINESLVDVSLYFNPGFNRELMRNLKQQLNKNKKLHQKQILDMVIVLINIASRPREALKLCPMDMWILIFTFVDHPRVKSFGTLAAVIFKDIKLINQHIKGGGKLKFTVSESNVVINLI